jgi:2-aminoadipate transaminase
MMVHRYLSDYDVDAHLKTIRKMYKRQRDLMVSLIEEEFPEEVQYTQPEGGMFLWVTLPEGMSSLELFELALKEKVAFVPGQAFYAEDPQFNTLRMNFSNSSEEKIEEGIKRLGNVIKKLHN